MNRYKCIVPCPIRLDCGHSCKLNCHTPNDPDHLNYNCSEMWERTPANCKFSHKCPKKCSECREQCAPCLEIIDRKLKCTHIVKGVICGKPEEDMKCRSKCRRTLPCGNYCPKMCLEQCGGCKVQVNKIVPECKHQIKVNLISFFLLIRLLLILNNEK